MRAAWAGLCCVLIASGPALARDITGARFTDPVTHYAHGILGDGIEYSGMTLRLSDRRSYEIRFRPGTRVFEDIAPRLWDVTGDGRPEVVVIETDPAQGAQLAIYGLGADGTPARLAATPHIGQPNRWLAPIGAADLDGDGRIEIAYIDRPHLTRRLRVWRYENGGLTHLADLDGLSNHRIGWDFIPGGIRDCGQGPEMVTADGDWHRVMVTTYRNGRLASRATGPYTGPGSLDAALGCD